MPAILPRLPLRSLMTSPMLRSGTNTSTSMIGSSSTGLASITAWRIAIAPASLKAMSLPSTWRVDPSSRRTLMSTSGLPVTTPCSAVSRIADPVHDRFLRDRLVLQREGRVFVDQLDQCRVHFFLVSLVLGADGGAVGLLRVFDRWES